MLALLASLTGCAQPAAGPITGSGTVEAPEIAVMAEIGGRVITVTADAGAPVKTGQLLVQLDDALARAQAKQADAAIAAAQAAWDLLAKGATVEQIRQAEAAVMGARAAYSRTLDAARPSEIDAAKAALAAAQAAYDKARVGPQPDDIAAADAALRNAEAALRLAQGAYDLAFSRNPAGIGASPQSLALEQATNNHAAAKAAADRARKPSDTAAMTAAYQFVQQARAALDRAQQPARATDIEQAQSQLDLAVARLDEIRAGARPEQLAAARAQIDASKAARETLTVQIAKLSLVAPADAVVTSRAIDPGEVALPGAQLLTLSRLDDLSVTVYIAEDRYGQIALGQTAEISSDSFAGVRFAGTVDRIANRAEFTPRNTQTADGRRTTVFAVRLKLGEGGGRLKPGMPVDVVFEP